MFKKAVKILIKLVNRTLEEINVVIKSLYGISILPIKRLLKFWTDAKPMKPVKRMIFINKKPQIINQNEKDSKNNNEEIHYKTRRSLNPTRNTTKRKGKWK